jgi:hypothetical protein
MFFLIPRTSLSVQELPCQLFNIVGYAIPTALPQKLLSDIMSICRHRFYICIQHYFGQYLYKRQHIVHGLLSVLADNKIEVSSLN